MWWAGTWGICEVLSRVGWSAAEKVLVVDEGATPVAEGAPCDIPDDLLQPLSSREHYLDEMIHYIVAAVVVVVVVLGQVHP